MSKLGVGPNTLQCIDNNTYVHVATADVNIYWRSVAKEPYPFARSELVPSGARSALRAQSKG